MLTPQDFRRASEQRFTTAEFLLERGYTLDAFYLAGYSVECILKSLVMHLTAETARADVFERLTHGAKMHYPEHLKEMLKDNGIAMPLELVKGLRRFAWSTDLRYESGRRPAGEVRGYLKVAKRVIDWARGEMA